MKESLSIVVSGEAGQGLATIEEFLVEALSKEYYVFTSKEVMSRVRGGNNTFELRVASSPIHSLRKTIDYLFLLNNNSFYRLPKRLLPSTVVFGEDAFVSAEEKEKYHLKYEVLELTKLAKEAGNRMFANTILFGYIAGMLELNVKVAEHLITQRFIHRGEPIVADNISAFTKGYELGLAYEASVKLKKPASVPPFKVIDGNNALGIGLLGGGINYLSSYPMSPGTSVMMYLTNKADEFGVLVEQAEDEIAALNMALGASYAGARAMVTTSGGGFALMTEAVSLAGIIETPAVIHVAQRPGPATGLPTRTEQGDLNLVVYAGHGEFPRIVLSPGKLEDGVLLAQKAFWLADKYQVPVFILSDQYWLESLGQMTSFELSEQYMESFTVISDKDYKRYQLTEDGISPRAIPGFGEGFVKVDSDEHDESGQITEDFDVRITMQNKRMKKRELLLADYQDTELIGPKDYKKLLVGWGSTYGVLKEFIETTSLGDVAYLYVKQPFPLPTSLNSYFDQAKQVVVVENNYTGQFANILTLELGVNVTNRVNKYNGEPFFIEELNEQLGEVLK